MSTNAPQCAPAEPKARRPRRMAGMPETAMPASTAPVAPSKLDRIEALLLADGGVTIASLMAATGWLQHSVRGAMAGALKKRGLTITSERIDGVRHYWATKPL